MKDFVRIDLTSELNRVDILHVFSRDLPDFTWRTGDSDAMGGYVSGLDESKVQIQIWTDKSPMDLFISFRASKSDLEYRSRVLDRVRQSLLEIGQVIMCDA